jgi:signal transduction histidine kinase
MRIFTTLIILLLFVQSSYGQTQKIDSLKKVLAKLPPEGNSYTGDTMRVRVLLGVGKMMVNPDSANFFWDSALKITKKNNWYEGEGEVYYKKGSYLNSRGFFYQSIDNTYKALHIAEKGKYRKLQGLCFYNFANSYINLGEYITAKDFYNKSFPLLKEANLKREYLFVWINIGLCDYYLKKYPESIKSYEKAIELNHQNQPFLQEVDYFSKSNIASSYRESDHDDIAIKYFQDALTYKHPNQNETVSVLSELALLYIKQKDFKNALKVSKKSEQLIVNKDNMAILASSEVLYLTYKGMGNTQEALKYYEIFMQETAKAQEQKQEDEIATLRFEYDNKKKQDSIELLNKDLDYQKVVRNVSWSGAAILLILGGFLFFSNRILKSKNIQIETQRNEILVIQSDLEQLNESLEVKVSERTTELTEANESLIRKNREIEEALYKGQSIERKRVASELHDNLGGTLSAIKWRLEGMEDDSMTLSEKLIYDSILGMLKDAYADLRLISHNLLPEELEKNGLKNSIQKLVNEINLSKKLEVWLSFRVDENLMDNKLKLELYSICLELLNNTLKHADATEVAINFFMREGALFLQVLDDGKGMTLSKDGTGMGMKNINIRVESLNGKLKISPQLPKGTSVVLEIPMVVVNHQ